jgi:hypothetical protein
MGPHRRVTIAASRARPRASRATRSSWPPLATSGVGSAPGGPDMGRTRRVRLLQAEHVPVSLARRVGPRPPRLMWGLRRRPKCGLQAARRDRSEPSTSPCRSRDALARARHGWRGVCAGLPRCGPQMARCYCSKPRRTSPCRSRACTWRPRCGHITAGRVCFRSCKRGPGRATAAPRWEHAHLHVPAGAGDQRGVRLRRGRHR